MGVMGFKSIFSTNQRLTGGSSNGTKVPLCEPSLSY